MGFVMEAMRNTVSLDIGMPWPTFCFPKALRYRICSLFVTAATTPGISPLSTADWNMRSIAAAALVFSVGNPADRMVQPKSNRIASNAHTKCDAPSTSSQAEFHGVAYLSSVMMARDFPLTSSSVWTLSRALKRINPGDRSLTTLWRSGVVDFSAPFSRYTTTTSLS